VPIRFELEQTFGAEEEPVEAALSFVSSVSVDHERNLYLLEGGRMSRLMSFAPDGTFRWFVEANGQGPGELNQPMGLAWAGDDSLYILNQEGSRLDRFDASGTYQGGRVLEGLHYAWLVGLYPSGILVYSNALAGWLKADVRVLRLGEKIDSVATITDDQSDGQVIEGFMRVPDVSRFRDELAVGHISEYRITRYGLNGELRRVVLRDMHDLVRPGFAHVNNMMTTSSLSRLGRPLPLEDGFWMVVVSWPTNVSDPNEVARMSLLDDPIDVEMRHSIDLYDEQDRLLYVLQGEGEEPEMGRVLGTDREGKLYTFSTEPYPQVRRYRVIIDGP
jgi:hypothetical protein